MWLTFDYFFIGIRGGCKFWWEVEQIQTIKNTPYLNPYLNAYMNAFGMLHEHGCKALLNKSKHLEGSEAALCSILPGNSAKDTLSTQETDTYCHSVPYWDLWLPPSYGGRLPSIGLTRHFFPQSLCWLLEKLRFTSVLGSLIKKKAHWRCPSW